MINNVVLMGRLTAAPELKYTQSGTSVLSFCLAVDRNYQKQGEERQADFLNCVAWRGTAEFIARYFDKGDMLAVTGEIQSRKYTDQNGSNRTAVEIIVNTASFCGGKQNNAAEYQPQQQAQQPAKPAQRPAANIDDFIPIEDDDLPF